MLLEMLMPKRIKCVVCDKEIEGAFICDLCKASIQFNIGRVCRYCGRMLLDHGVQCQNCKGMIKFFDNGVSAVIYDDYIKKVLFNFKYNEKTHLGEMMANEILKKLSDSVVDYDFIVPVPLHKNRLKKRGYNQALIIAEFLSEKSGIPLDQSLIRSLDTKALFKLQRHERQVILEDAFKSSNIKGNILLVDDIFTSGSTLNYCSKALKEGGARYVTVATFAVGD